MPHANGRLPATALAPIPGGQLREDAAAAWNAMCADAARRRLPVPRPAGPVSSYRDLAEQVNRKRIQHAGGPTAATPGTSNHGWGVAVDVIPAAWPTMRQLGPRYGFDNVEGARVGEAWHWSNPAGGAARFPDIPASDPLAVLTAIERRWARELRQLRRAGRNRPRRVALRRALIRARKRAWRAKQRQPTRLARRRHHVLTRLTA